MASADREEESLVEEDTSSVPLSGYFTKQGTCVLKNKPDILFYSADAS